MRHPVRWAVSLALLGALVAGVLVAAAGRTHRGTGVAPGVVSQPGLTPVPLAQTAAHGYNPFGTGPENRDQVQNVVDSDPNTTWSTEEYYAGNLDKPGGVGAGLYLDAAPGLVGKAIEIQTATPGFAVQIYVANRTPASLPYGDSTSLAARGWQGPVGQSGYVRSGARIPLVLAGQLFRYYLIWITALPPNMDSASIGELTLFR
jgi:serine/threonine-protein kinase